MSSGVWLRVVVSGVSPFIVRTIGISAGVSLSQMHRMLLACFGWSGECRHVFEISGRSFSDTGDLEANDRVVFSSPPFGLKVLGREKSLAFYEWLDFGSRIAGAP